MNTQSLKDLVARYLNQELSSEAFQAQLIAESWENSPVDPELNAIVSEAELRLAEYTNGHLSEKELKQALKAALYGWSLAGSSKALFVSNERDQGFTVTAGTSSLKEDSALTLSPPSSWAGTGLVEVHA